MFIGPDMDMDSAANISGPDQPKCLVCGCNSTGVHYGVVACEGCKAFYKRGLTKSVEYKCYFGGNCVVGPSTGGRCKSCRFQKCVVMGMQLQTTKMGRTPKRKADQGKEPKTGLKHMKQESTSSNENQPGIRKIAPAPSKFPKPPVSIREDNFGHFAVHTSVIQRISRTPSHSSREATPSTRSHSSRLSISSSDSETRESPQSLHDPFYVKFPLLSRRDGNGIARFSPDSLWNLRGFSIDASSLENPPSWVPSDVIPSLTEDLTGESVSSLPPFLGQYWHVLREGQMYVDRTIVTVSEAIESVYGPEFHLYDAFMRDALVHGLVPHQPQCTRKTALKLLRQSQIEMLQKQCRFMMQLTGFSELNPDDQRTLVTEKWFETWMVVYQRYVRGNDMYYVIGSEALHHCSYWATQFFVSDYLSLAVVLVQEFKQLRLTSVETFLFLAVATFSPDTTTVKDKTTLSLLHAHYLDCLLQSIRARQELPARTKNVDNLFCFMAKFRVLYRLSNLYCRDMDWTQLPVAPQKDGVPVSIADIMAVEDDGLDGPVVVPLTY